MQHVVLALAAFASGFAGFVPTHPPHIDVRLMVESTAPRSGQTQFVGLQMTPLQGWHGYWSNPGEAGLAPTVKWTVPAGVHFGPLQHPAPTLLQVQGLTSFVHAGPHVLISRMTVDRGLQPGTALPIAAQVSWAACSDKLCVPERATLALEMTVGQGAPSVDAPAIRRALAAEPKVVSPGAFEVRDGKLVLQFPRLAGLDPRRAHFFPDENGLFDPADARVISGLPLRIAAPARGPVPARITGVVSDGSVAFELTFKRGELSTPHTGVAQPSPVALPLTSPQPAHEETPLPLVHSSRKQQATPSAWTRLAEAALAALGLSATAILLARRRRKGRA